MDSQQFSVKFSEYALKHHKEEISGILKNLDGNQNFSIVVHFVTLCEEQIELGGKILTEPEKYLSICNEGLILAQRSIFDESSNGDELPKDLKIKTKVCVRITALPSYSELHRTVFPRNDDIGNFLTISGTLVKVTAPKLLEYQRDFICSKCHSVATVKADYELHYIISPPKKCANDCNNCNFKAVKGVDQCNYKDYQEVKIQEQIGMLNIGNMPQSMWVTVEDDLVDTCKPGDDVIIYGTVMRRWRPLNVDTKSDIELVLKANNIQVCNDQKAAMLVTDEMREAFDKYWEFHKHQPLAGRNHILASFCPQVYGLYLVKLAVVMVLAGGVQKSDDTGCKIRGESHLLLVGDPGTGKSHLLRFASKVCTRSVLTTGVGSTTAGLTVSAVREGGDWQLEAGALVLADGGICCIDEFNSIREHDRTSIHEAMEQQTISVAKAGMVTKLNTRCSILAATNPKGSYDSEVPMSVNIALASPLLSRFDLVLVLLDSRNPEWDKLVSSFILEGGKNPFVSQENHSTVSSQQLESDIWSLDKLQAYFSLIRTLNPLMTREANMVLSKYYQAQRMADSRNVARTTVRMLESLVRLSQGHARLMFRKEVTIQDAVVAVSLIESSMQNSALLAGINALHTAFPNSSNDEYKTQAELILKKLKLDDLLEQEKQKLSQLNNISFVKPNDGPGPSTSYNQHNFVKPFEKPAKTDFSQRLNEVLTGIKRTKDKNMYEVVKLNKIAEPPAKRKRTEGKEPGAKQPKSKTSRKSIIIDSDSETDEKDESKDEESRIKEHDKKNEDDEKNEVEESDTSKDNSHLISSDSEDMFAEVEANGGNARKSKKKLNESANESKTDQSVEDVGSSGSDDEQSRFFKKKTSEKQASPKLKFSVRKTAKGDNSKCKNNATAIKEKANQVLPSTSSSSSKNEKDTSFDKNTNEEESPRLKNMFAQFRFNKRDNGIKKITVANSDESEKNKEVEKSNSENSFANHSPKMTREKNTERNNLHPNRESDSILENSPLSKKSSTVSKSTLDKLMKFKKVDKETPEKKSNESFDYGNLKKLASLGKILSQENRISSQTLKNRNVVENNKTEVKNGSRNCSQSSQNVFQLDEVGWDDADLEL